MKNEYNFLRSTVCCRMRIRRNDLMKIKSKNKKYKRISKMLQKIKLNVSRKHQTINKKSSRIITIGTNDEVIILKSCIEIKSPNKLCRSVLGEESQID